MTWYLLIIAFLGVASALSIAVIAYLVEVINDLRIENVKLRIDLLHK